MRTGNHEHQQSLPDRADAFARVALSNIVREYPHHEFHLQTGPEPVPTPRQLHPCFYGSFDWHSCVEMFWVLIRLLRTTSPDDAPHDEIRRVLDDHLTTDALAVEAAYFGSADQRMNQRPYGWSALLELTHEAETWADPDGQRWATALRPLAEIFTARYLDWLPHATYPVRSGVHTNSAFSLSRTLPFARHRAANGDPRLLHAITQTSLRWFAQDQDYPGGWEPSGFDFLSPALTEADLLARLQAPNGFADWLDDFLPNIAERQPAALFEPAVVSDSTDGLIAHLHGLNLSRAWCWQRIAKALPADDARVVTMLATAQDHTDAALTHATGGPYSVEHWLVYYAVLLLS